MSIPTVAITGKVLTPSGAAPASGTIACHLSQAGSVLDGVVSDRVAAETIGTIAAGGTVAGLTLIPNDAITPAGTYYRVTICAVLADGRQDKWTEKWQIPSGGALDIGAVPRLGVVPGVALAPYFVPGDATAMVVTATGSSTARSLADIAADVVTGEVRLPSTFPATGVRFFLGRTGGYSTTFNPSKYAATWGITKTYYVNRTTGNDSTGNGTSSTPWKTIAGTYAFLQASADVAIKIEVQTNGADVLFFRDEFFSGANFQLSGKRIYIAPDLPGHRVYVTSAQTLLSWSLTPAQTNTYQTTRSSTMNVLDMSSKDANGIPRSYTYQSSIATVEATAGSWWASGSTVYVHTLTNVSPVEGTHLVAVGVPIFGMDLGNSAEIFLRNIYMVGTAAGVTAAVQNITADYTATKFVAWNCAFTGANPAFLGSAGKNGLSIESVKAVQIFNSVSAYNSADGFNFHYTRIGPTPPRDYYALVVNSLAYDNGLLSNTNNNNAFTGHEGVNVACVGCTGSNTKGPVFAFVNGVNFVGVGCNAGASVSSASDTQHAAYYFDNVSPPTGVTGAAYLDDCIGNDSLWDVSTEGSTLPVTLRRFVGSKIPTATLPYVTFLP